MLEFSGRKYDNYVDEDRFTLAPSVCDSNGLICQGNDISFRTSSSCILRFQPEFGSSALLMKLACLVRNDRMRDEVANENDLRFGVLLCSHLHFFPFLQDERLQRPVCVRICY